MESVWPRDNFALISSITIFFVILLAKGRFIFKILKARTDVNVFNHSMPQYFVRFVVFRHIYVEGRQR